MWEIGHLVFFGFVQEKLDGKLSSSGLPSGTPFVLSSAWAKLFSKSDLRPKWVLEIRSIFSFFIPYASAWKIYHAGLVEQNKITSNFIISSLESSSFSDPIFSPLTSVGALQQESKLTNYYMCRYLYEMNDGSELFQKIANKY